jgi:hypothetical protein
MLAASKWCSGTMLGRESLDDLHKGDEEKAEFDENFSESHVDAGHDRF